VPRRNSRCAAASAVSISFSATTKEILRAEAPCAIAIVSVLAGAMRRMGARQVPRTFFPTTVAIATVQSRVMCSTFS
jgi:hypothetical protein